MPVSLIGANVVLLAKNHNPSIISKDWLKRKGIVVNNVMNFTHTPSFSFIETDNFTIIADPERLQLSLKKSFEDLLSDLKDKTLSYTKALPEIPYKAIGFNFEYKIEKEKTLIQKFYCSETKIENIFSGNYQLGGIIKYQFKDFTVKLVINPYENEEITATFNYHCQLNENLQPESIINMHDKTYLESNRILKRLIDE